ncbi:MAG: polysaccharide deacetylase family protein [Oscillospiraceae bacterium]|nr:polysaccharide deacetylase family protein [Oscillospiraceae bacterium]
MAKWKKGLAAGLLALSALALAAAQLGAPARTQAVLGEVKLPAGPYVALTFDDGPRAATTTPLLDGLAQRGVHATFFVIGENVEGNELLLQRMEGEGHQVGLHTYHHKSLDGLNASDFYAEVDQLRETLTALLGRTDFMLRPPYGMMSPAAQARAAAPIILWSVDPEDWSDRDTGRQTAAILDNVKDGDIILLHDIYPASVDTALQVVDALMVQGYHFVTVEELFAIRGRTPERGAVYRRLPPD